jgi:RNA polymerase sigma factor (sigma-70 family)
MPRRFYFPLLHHVVETSDIKHVPDIDLLRRFERDRDSAALELIVRRHADTVWTACRRILSSSPDAEDAFQATFLVLVKKSASIRGSSIGGWLHRVAVNAALKIREISSQHPIASQDELAVLPAKIPNESDDASVVQEEIASLPERYRLPIVMCELESHSHAEAAKVLGWPVGSLSSRLSRARKLLRQRLIRRGIAAPALIFPAADIPSSLISDTTAVATGSTAAVPGIQNLTQGVISLMRAKRIKLTTIWILSIGLFTATGFGTYAAFGQNKTAEPAKETTIPLPNLDRKEHNAQMNTKPVALKVPNELLELRLTSARQAYDRYKLRLQIDPNASFSDVFGWSERWLDAELALKVKPEDRVKALRAHLDRCRELERLTAEFAKIGQHRNAESDAATYYRAQAEILLLNEGVEPHPAKENKNESNKK